MTLKSGLIVPDTELSATARFVRLSSDTVVFHADDVENPRAMAMGIMTGCCDLKCEWRKLGYACWIPVQALRDGRANDRHFILAAGTYFDLILATAMCVRRG